MRKQKLHTISQSHAKDSQREMQDDRHTTEDTGLHGLTRAMHPIEHYPAPAGYCRDSRFLARGA